MFTLMSSTADRQMTTATRSHGTSMTPTKGSTTMSTVTGRTAIIGVQSIDDVHVVTVDGEDHSARSLVRPGVPTWLEPAAHAPVLTCLECGRSFSAHALYAESPVAGECLECAWDNLVDAFAPAGSSRSSDAA